jgi:hypothetical protein
MGDKRRVVISGLGAITPIGLTADGLWDGLRAQRSKVREISRFDSSLFRSRLAAQVDDFDPGDFLEAKRTKRLDRFGQFSVAAARLALEDSEIDLAAEDKERIGAMMGTALGGVGYAEEQCSVFYTGSVKDVDPALALMVFGGASSCNIAIEFGVMGPNSTNAMSCAIGYDRDWRGIPADSRRLCRRDARRWCRGAAVSAVLWCVRADQGDEYAQRRSVHGITTVRQGSRRLCDGRGCECFGFRGEIARDRAWCQDLRRDRGLRDVERRVPHDGAAPGRDAGCDARCGARWRTREFRRTKSDM